MNAKKIKAEGVKFERMKFLNEVPKVEVANISEKKCITYRTTEAVTPLSFRKAELQRSSWRNTELLQVDKKGNVSETAIPALSFAGADISGADFSQALYRGKTVSNYLDRALETNDFGTDDIKGLNNIFINAKYNSDNPPKLVEGELSEDQWKQVVTIFKKRKNDNANQ